jgi:hypothetical protein
MYNLFIFSYVFHLYFLFKWVFFMITVFWDMMPSCVTHTDILDDNAASIFLTEY